MPPRNQNPNRHGGSWDQELMERKKRFELSTLALARRCSTAELLPLVNGIPLFSYKDGAAGQNRTGDTRIFSPLLYRLSYRGILLNGGVDGNRTRDLRRDRPACLPLHHDSIGGGSNRVRTYDPLLVRQVLSQLSYAPAHLVVYLLRSSPSTTWPTNFQPLPSDI